MKDRACYLLQTDLFYWADLWYQAALPFTTGFIESTPRNGEIKITKRCNEIGLLLNMLFCQDIKTCSLFFCMNWNTFSLETGKKEEKKWKTGIYATVKNILIIAAHHWNQKQSHLHLWNPNVSVSNTRLDIFAKKNVSYSTLKMWLLSDYFSYQTNWNKLSYLGFKRKIH